MKYYGKIDLDRELMPPRSVIFGWEKEARATYSATMNKSFERYQSDYVWDKIGEWQRRKREQMEGMLWAVKLNGSS